MDHCAQVLFLYGSIFVWKMA